MVLEVVCAILLCCAVVLCGINVWDKTENDQLGTDPALGIVVESPQERELVMDSPTLG